MDRGRLRVRWNSVEVHIVAKLIFASGVYLIHLAKMAILVDGGRIILRFGVKVAHEVLRHWIVQLRVPHILQLFWL